MANKKTTSKTKTSTSKAKSQNEDTFVKASEDLEPLSTSFASGDTKDRTSRRSNSTIFSDGSVSQRFPRIDEGIIPFNTSNSSITGNSNIDIRDTIVLTQKAYYNFAILRNTIDLMTEFSVNDLFLEGGSKKSVNLFKAWFNFINIKDLQDRFFREYYRSGNVFLYKFTSKLTTSDSLRLSKLFKSESSVKAKSEFRLPVRYTLLNPADIQVAGNLIFDQQEFLKTLNNYELQRLKNPQTEQDKQVLEGLPKNIRDKLKQKNIHAINIPLDPDRIRAVFYKKQDYEPFAVPMSFPVLDDIEWKQEMKKIDKSTIRTMQQAILLVTMGTETQDGKLYIDQKQKKQMQKLFENESVGRVLISDFTTDAKFVIPDIGDIINPDKYKVVDQDIRMGLNVLLAGDEKFANQSAKVEVFLERLKHARESFLNNFLIPEMENIAEIMGLKNIPTPKFKDNNFKDQVQLNRIYSRMAEIGLLTPEETFEAMENGRLPEPTESVENQKKFRELRQESLYQPLVGRGNIPPEEDEDENGETVPQQGGRPPGTNTPQSTKNVNPIGTPPAKGSEGYSLRKLSENFALATELNKEVSQKIKEAHNIKRLNKKQKEIIDEICQVIVCNEEPTNWRKKIETYIKEPIDRNHQRVNEVDKIAAEHGINHYLAGILKASEKE